jgi:hypothetical protein
MVVLVVEVAVFQFGQVAAEFGLVMVAGLAVQVHTPMVVAELAVLVGTPALLAHNH